MNVLSGFFISWGMWVFVVAPLFAIPYHGTQGFLITCMFTVSSLARSYMIRRVFNNGWHRASHWIATKIEGEERSEEPGSADAPTCYRASLSANDREI
jgi:hypothetical protein